LPRNLRYGVTDDTEDPDDMLVPELVELVLVEKLAGIMEFIWNPLSSQQSSRALKTIAYV